MKHAPQHFVRPSRQKLAAMIVLACFSAISLQTAANRSEQKPSASLPATTARPPVRTRLADDSFRPLQLPDTSATESEGRGRSRNAAGFSILESPVSTDTGLRRSRAAEETFRKLIFKADAQGSVRVIVQLSVPFQPEGRLKINAQVGRQREQIRAAQAQLVSRLGTQHIKNVKNFPFIPFVAMEVDASGVRHLEQLPDVIALQEDVWVPPLLEESSQLIGATNAWSSGYPGTNQVVAILDTGVDKTHSFLSGKVVSEACYSTNSTNSTSLCPGEVAESVGPGSGANCNPSLEGCEHGTHVAGIAAGTGTSFSGIAKGAKIIAIQVFSRFDNANDCGDEPAPCIGTLTSDYTLGLLRVQALSSTFNIAAANMSLGGGRYSDQPTCDLEQACTKAAIDNLRSLGIATIIASGNDGYTDSTTSPGCISSAVTVGSTDDGSHGTTADEISIFDSMGHASNSAPFLDLLAPGRWIKSSVPGDDFEDLQGTSMAAPHVTGAWAVLKAKSPSASVDEIQTALNTTGVSVTDPRNNLTRARIQIDAALNVLGAPNLAPHNPATIDQLRIYANAGLLEGGSTTERAVRFRATVSDPDGDPVRFQIELRATSEPFTAKPTLETGLSVSGSQVTITRTDLAFGNYKWAYRAVDAGGLASSWIEYGTPGNTDFSRIQIPNDYVRIDHLYRTEESGTSYLNVRWTLLRKWNDAAIAVYPSLNENLPSINLSSVFEPLFVGLENLTYTEFRSLGMSLDQAQYMWKPVGAPCNDSRPGSPEYTVGNQYTTRFSRVFDMFGSSWVDAANITPADNIRFTVYDRTHPDASPCNMDFKEAFPDSTNYHAGSNPNLNDVPNGPTVIDQLRIYANAGLLEGGNTTESAVRFRATVSDPDGDPVKFQIELRQTFEPFTGSPTTESALNASGSQVTVTRAGLVFGNYKWAYRAMDASGLASPWVEYGTPGNTDFSRVQIPNDYVRIDQIYHTQEGATSYLNVRWTLLRKWNEATVAVYPSLNENLPSLTLGGGFEPLFVGSDSLNYTEFSSLGINLDQGEYIWKPVGAPCNNSGPGPGEYTVGNQYTTRFSRVFDMFTFSWTDAADVTSLANIRFTVYDHTQFNSFFCNMNFKEAFPDSANYHAVGPTASNSIVTGRIVDAHGNPLAGTVVQLSGTQNRKFITDANGVYRFDHVDTVGFYSVTPSRANYEFSPSMRSFNQLGQETQAVFTANATGQRANPLDTPEYFVRQHYLDFLGREPDEAGFNFWSDQISECGNNHACLDRRRENVSAAFYLSIEFQETGYLVERMYKISYGNGLGTSTLGGTHQFPVPIVRLNEFLPDTQELSRGVVVGTTDWEQVLENNKRNFIDRFVQRARFLAAFPTTMTDSQFVDKLNNNAGGVLLPDERIQLINELSSGAKTRAQVVRTIAEDSDLVTTEKNCAFVLMQYFGYLRRNPNDSPDANHTGYEFWLNKLNQFAGNFVNAEMVKAFLVSGEYRQRFGQ